MTTPKKINLSYSKSEKFMDDKKNHDSCFSSLTSVCTDVNRRSSLKLSSKRLLPNFSATPEQLNEKKNQLSQKLERKFVKSLININNTDDDSNSVTSQEVANILAGAPEMRSFEDEYEPINKSDAKIFQLQTGSNHMKDSKHLSIDYIKSKNSSFTNNHLSQTMLNAQIGLTLFRILNLRKFEIIPITIIRIYNCDSKFKNILPFKFDEKDLCFERSSIETKKLIDKFKVLIISSIYEDSNFFFIDGSLKTGDMLIEVNGHNLLSDYSMKLSDFYKSQQLNMVIARTKAKRKPFHISNYNQ